MTNTARTIRLPDPPRNLDHDLQSYLRALNKVLEQNLLSQKSRGRVEATTINATQLPTSSAGLATGEFWNDAGTVKVV
jgi:hypothetical protein